MTDIRFEKGLYVFVVMDVESPRAVPELGQFSYGLIVEVLDVEGIVETRVVTVFAHLTPGVRCLIGVMFAVLVPRTTTLESQYIDLDTVVDVDENQLVDHIAKLPRKSCLHDCAQVPTQYVTQFERFLVKVSNRCFTRCEVHFWHWRSL
jgi:hypothetical protein